MLFWSLVWLCSLGFILVEALNLRRGDGDVDRQLPDYWLKMSNYQNVQYFGEFTVGGQTLPVIYDTGSFEVIVLSTLCKDCEVGSPIYDANQSPTFSKGDGVVAEHVFGSGPVVSQRGLEICQVGPTNSPLMTTMMPFWQVMDHNINVWDRWAMFSGIIGLGHTPHPPALAGGQRASTPPDTLGSAPTDDDFVLLERLGVTAFSICLERGEGTPPGWLKMGHSVEVAKDSPDFRHIHVVGQYHWGVEMTQLRAGGQERTNPCNPSCAAIIDSGTSLIAAPPAAMDALSGLFSSIKADCSNLDSLPDIEFSLGGEIFALPPAIYVMQLTHFEKEPQPGWDPPKLKTVTECVPSFMSIDLTTEDSGPLWILGMPFLRYYHTVFQRSPKTMHIAYADPNCEPTPNRPSIFLNTSRDVNGVSTGVPAKPSHKPSNSSSLKHLGVSHITLPRAERGHSPGIRVPSWAKNGAKIKL